MATTSEVVIVDGITLNQFSYNISTGTGRYSVPDVRGEKLYLPGRSGYLPMPNQPYNEGESTLSMWVLGCNTDGTIPTTQTLRRQKFESNLASLIQIFSVRSRLVHVTAVQADTTTRECWAEVQDRVDPSTMAGRTRAEFNVSLLIPDVYWQGTTTNTQVSTAGGALPQTLQLTGLQGMTGTVEDAVLTVTGPIQNPRVTDLETGVWVQLNDTLTASDTWTVDCGQYTSKKNAADATINTSHSGHFRYLIIPSYQSGFAFPRVQLSGSGGGGTTKVQVACHAKFFGA